MTTLNELLHKQANGAKKPTTVFILHIEDGGKVYAVKKWAIENADGVDSLCEHILEHYHYHGPTSRNSAIPMIEYK